MSEFAASSSLEASEAEKTLAQGKSLLLAARRQRPRPGLDTKVLTSWNALMLRSLAEAAIVFGNHSYANSATLNAGFLLRAMRNDGSLMHVWTPGRAKIPAYLDDYALLIAALLAVHEATSEQHWLTEAVSLTDDMIRRFADKELSGVMFDTSDDHSSLFIRPRDTADSVTPSGASSAADALLRMAVVTGEVKYHDLALAMLSTVHHQMIQHPLASGQWLCCLDFVLQGPTEVTIVGDPGEDVTERFAEALGHRYLPNRVLVRLRPGRSPDDLLSPDLKHRTEIGGRPTAYLCHHHACQPPATEVTSFERLLDQVIPQPAA